MHDLAFVDRYDRAMESIKYFKVYGLTRLVLLMHFVVDLIQIVLIPTMWMVLASLIEVDPESISGPLRVLLVS